MKKMSFGERIRITKRGFGILRKIVRVFPNKKHCMSSYIHCNLL